jgi:hypothetical protein
MMVKNDDIHDITIFTKLQKSFIIVLHRLYSTYYISCKIVPLPNSQLLKVPKPIPILWSWSQSDFFFGCIINSPFSITNSCKLVDHKCFYNLQPNSFTILSFHP